MSATEIVRRFTYHPPTAEQAHTMSALRLAIAEAARAVSETCPDCRETSLAVTKLEEAAYWAIAALARPPAEGGAK